jgi:hypothetical protein
MMLAKSAGYEPLLARLYMAIKRVVGAERVYTLITLEGAAHFHAWLVARGTDVQARGVAFLADDLQCAESEAVSATEAICACLIS